MKATVLVDNIPCGTLQGEWGLSIYIEYNGVNILLDGGASELYLENAEKLGCDISTVSYAALSHAHNDHSNGMDSFFACNDKAKYYLQELADENCYFKYWLFHRYIGIRRNTLDKYKDRIEYVSGKHELCEGVYLLSHSTPGLGKLGKREHMYVKRDGRWYPDDFAHEQSLVFETDEGLVIFNSCSHGGAANIICEVKEAFPEKKVHAMIGGFHLYNKTEEEVRSLARAIKMTGIEYVCTGHCTGDKAYSILEDELGEMLHQLHVGFVWGQT